MRRPFPVAFSLSVTLFGLGTVLALAPLAVAQRGSIGGGHAGFASHGFGGSFAGHSSGAGFAGRIAGSGRVLAEPERMPYGFGAGRPMFGATPRMNWAAPARSYNPGYRGNYGGGPVHDGGRRGHYRPPYRGYGYGGYGGYPYAYTNSWELLPWDLGYPDFTGENGYDNGYDSGYDNDAGPAQPGYDDGPVPQGYQGEQQAAEPMPPPDDAYRPGYDGESYQLPAAMPAAPAALVAPEPQLMLIFKDGHEQAIRNFVLTANAVIVLDQAASGRQLQIPLIQLNVPATQHAAQQQGLDFNPPA